jgi:hypothetical protein
VPKPSLNQVPAYHEGEVFRPEGELLHVVPKTDIDRIAGEWSEVHRIFTISSGLSMLP